MSMSHEDPSNRLTVLQWLRSASFPATRDELLRHARSLGADESSLTAIAGLPDGPFETPQELARLLAPVPASGAGSGPRGLSTAGDDTADHPSLVNPPDATA
jgi:hypothetical protein